MSAGPTWRDVALYFPPFVQWAVAKHGFLPDGEIQQADYKRLAAEYMAQAAKYMAQERDAAADKERDAAADKESAPELRRCCGILMAYQEVFGIRVWWCAYRSHHARLYENLRTGEVVSDDTLKVMAQAIPGDGA